MYRESFSLALLKEFQLSFRAAPRWVLAPSARSPMAGRGVQSQATILFHPRSRKWWFERFVRSIRLCFKHWVRPRSVPPYLACA
jgi:hypothetical protein